MLAALVGNQVDVATSAPAGLILARERGVKVRYFAPGEIPWEEIAFRTTEAALRDWMKLAAPPSA